MIEKKYEEAADIKEPECKTCDSHNWSGSLHCKTCGNYYIFGKCKDCDNQRFEKCPIDQEKLIFEE